MNKPKDIGTDMPKELLDDARRDKSTDNEIMELPTIAELQLAETVEEYKERPPSFAACEVIVDCTVSLPFAKPRTYKQGQRICVTPITYKHMNDSNPCLKPANESFRSLYKRYDGQDLTGKTLFAWRAGGIGDLLFIRPILVHLRKKYGCKVIFSTKEQYHDLVKYWDDAIDQLCDINFDVDETMCKADYHLTFEGVIERVKESETTDVHDVFCKLAGLNADDIEWTVPMSAPIDNAFFAGNTGKYVVVQPRASAPVRTPFAGSFIRAINICTAHGYRVIIADGPHMTRYCDDLVSTCANPEMVVNFSRYTGGLHDSVELVNRAAFVIAPDSAFTHIAAMQGVPSIAFYGPFPSNVRTVRYPLCIAIETAGGNCCKFGGRECFLHAPHGRCESNYECWNTLDGELIDKTVRDLIATIEADTCT